MEHLPCTSPRVALRPACGRLLLVGLCTMPSHWNKRSTRACAPDRRRRQLTHSVPGGQTVFRPFFLASTLLDTLEEHFRGAGVPTKGPQPMVGVTPLRLAEHLPTSRQFDLTRVHLPVGCTLAAQITDWLSVDHRSI